MELTALPPGIFTDLIALDELWLHDNELTRLPAGVFSGLPGFTTLSLHDNPGVPFALTLQLVRTDHTTFGGTVAVQVAEGAPFDIELPVSAAGGALSAHVATIGAGRIVGDSVAVTRQPRPLSGQDGRPRYRAGRGVLGRRALRASGLSRAIPSSSPHWLRSPTTLSVPGCRGSRRFTSWSFGSG